MGRRKTVIGYMIAHFLERPEEWKWYWNNGLKFFLSTLIALLCFLLLGRLS